MSTTDSTIDTTGTESNPTSEAPPAPDAHAAKPAKKAMGSKPKSASKKASKPQRKQVKAAKKSARKIAKARKSTGVREGFSALPVLFPTPAVVQLDKAWKRLGLPSRMEFFRRAISAFLAAKGEKKAAAFFAEPKGGKAKGRK